MDENEPERPEQLITRIIREQIAEGRLEEMIAALEAVRHPDAKPGTIATTPQKMSTSFGSQDHLPGTIETQLQPLTTSFGASLEIKPSFKAELKLVPAMESASPELAEKIRLSDPERAMLLLNLFMALMQVVQTLAQFYQITHSEPPTPTQIVQIFNNTTNYVINK